MPNLRRMGPAGVFLFRFLFFALLASSLAGCVKKDTYKLYTFDPYCSLYGNERLDTCQPCNYMGPKRSLQRVEFVDSATGSTVTAEVLARPTFLENHADEQKQQCYYKALRIAGGTDKLEISADAKEARFVVIWREERYEISKKDLRYTLGLLPPLQDSATLYNLAPPNHPESRLKEAWLAAGLGLIRLRVQNDDGSFTTLIKKYGN